jgi:hypothetical protein
VPAPSRRNVGASLAQKVSTAGRIEALPDRRDRQAAHRSRHAGQWEDAAASLVAERPVVRVPPSSSKPAKERKREALLIRAAASASRRALRVTLDQPCPIHGAPAGQLLQESPLSRIRPSKGAIQWTAHRRESAASERPDLPMSGCP